MKLSLYPDNSDGGEECARRHQKAAVMRLSLYPDPGTGRQWRIALEVAGTEFEADIAQRRRRLPDGRTEIVNRSEAWTEAARIAAALGLDKLESEDDEHGTWTR